MVSFVILHYNTIDETLRCLQNLKETFETENYQAIVVDNHTLSEEQLREIKKYTNDVILLEDNLGFAKANNIGCAYAIEKYNPDFLVVINNDVFITQKDFIKIMEDDYKNYKFDMLGPWIDSPTKESCNPFPVIYGKEIVEKKIKYTEKLIKIYKNPILYVMLNVYLKIKHIVREPIIPTNGKELKKGVPLHGCAIVFSKQYYQKYKDIFFNETFLFHEEEFLYDRVVKDKLVSLYDPKISVYHKEGSSVNKKGTKRISKLFKEKEKLESLKLLRKTI